MLRVVFASNAIPFSFPVNPASEFQPGMIAQLGVLGNSIVCGVSDGICPIGIIDDVKSKSFTSVSVDESIIIGPVVGVPGPDGRLVLAHDVKAELENAYVLEGTFVSNVDCQLIAKNGVVVFLAGTPLNIDLSNTGVPDGIRASCSYAYRVNNIPGDDSTAGSHRVTVWFNRGLFQTDQFDTTVRYPINANLFCGEDGKLTTRKPSDIHPGIGIVTAPPTAIYSSLEFMWL